MSGPIDILGIGCVAVDDLVNVEDYPAAKDASYSVLPELLRLGLRLEA